MKKQFKSFKDARDFAHTLNFKDVKDWRKFTKHGNKPHDIPAWPNETYLNKGWVSWGDFLGTGVISNRKKQYLSFEDARKFARSLKLKGKSDWEKYKKNLPHNIPKNPNQVYKSEWKGWTDWLTGKLGRREKRKQYLSFEESRMFVRKLKLKNRQEWREYSKSDTIPIFIPVSPEKIYKNEWISMSDWLGTGFIPLRNRRYRSFGEAKKFVHTLNMKRADQWRKYSKSAQKPKDIPADPANVYKNKGWKNMGDWLGTGFIATKEREYMLWIVAKPLYEKISKDNSLQNMSDWKKYTKTHKLPKGLPPDPWQVYTQKNILRRSKKK